MGIRGRLRGEGLDVPAAKGIQNGIGSFFMERGLGLSERKTIITSIEEGFDFLSVNCREYPDGKFRTTLSRDSMKDIRDNIKQVLRINSASTQMDTILELNTKITGMQLPTTQRVE